MPDPRFFARKGPFSLAQLAEVAGVALAEGVDSERTITDVAPLDKAGPQDVSFLDNRRYLGDFAATRAGACVVAPEHAGRAPAATAVLLSDQPYRAYALIARAFYPPPAVVAGTAATATVDAAARLGPGCRIAPGAVVEAGAEMGARCEVGPNAVIGVNVVLGDDCRIGANVSLSHCLVGDRVTIHPGARIGQDGFGFAPDPAGHVKVPQLGRVVIGDDCEIGANTTIDRGSGPDTVIGANCWIDNLVQIGHNVQIGRGCILVAQVGISGSTRLDDFAVLGGQAGLAGHLRVGAGARIGAQSGVTRDVPAGETWAGYPARPIREHFRQLATLARLSKAKGTDDG